MIIIEVGLQYKKMIINQEGIIHHVLQMMKVEDRMYTKLSSYTKPKKMTD